MVFSDNIALIPARGKSAWIADRLRGRIMSGELTGKLPSERTLATIYNVNFKTASKALRILVDEGLVKRKAPHGTFVKRDEATPFSGMRPASTCTVSLLIRTQGHLFENLAGALIEKLGDAKHPTTVTGLGAFNDPSGTISARVEHAVDRRPDFLVAGEAEYSIRDLELMEKRSGRVIHISRRPFELEFDTNADFVLSDPWLGAYIATKHLLDTGHERPLFLTHANKKVPPRSFRNESAYLMFAGYRDAMAEAGLTNRILVFGERTIGETLLNESELLELFDSPNAPDAVFASQDYRITRNAELLKSAGLDFGRDVVGYNDTPWSRGETPFPSISIREKAVAEMIFEHIEGKRRGLTVVPPVLV